MWRIRHLFVCGLWTKIKYLATELSFLLFWTLDYVIFSVSCKNCNGVCLKRQKHIQLMRLAVYDENKQKRGRDWRIFWKNIAWLQIRLWRFDVQISPKRIQIWSRETPATCVLLIYLLHFIPMNWIELTCPLLLFDKTWFVQTTHCMACLQFDWFGFYQIRRYAFNYEVKLLYPNQSNWDQPCRYTFP